MEKKQDNLMEISDLTVRYNTDDAVVHAVNNFNLKLVRGEARGLVGETGAGKPTLALSILRLLPERVGEVTGGSIVYDGQELLNLPEAEMLPLRGKRISMIFQDPMTSLNPTQTVGDQILEVLNLHFPEMTREEKISYLQAGTDCVISESTSKEDLVKLLGIAEKCKRMEKAFRQFPVSGSSSL